MPTMTQRVALWKAHKKLCRYCDKPIESFETLDIDHLVPVHLTEDELKALLSRIGFPDLDIQSYANWVPSHGFSCNRRKGGLVFSDSALITHLEIAKADIPRVLKEEAIFTHQAQASDALAKLSRQIELGFIAKDTALAYISGIQTFETPRRESIVLSFSTSIYDDSHSVKSLEMKLRESSLVFARVEGPQDTGETLSVRYAVWLLDIELIPKTFDEGWQLFSVDIFSELYPNSEPDDLLEIAVIQRSHDLVLDLDSDDPLPYSRCPHCGKAALHRTSQSHPKYIDYFIWCDCGWADRTTG